MLQTKMVFYGKETKWAVRLFQQDRGLPVDGIVGPATYNALMGCSSFYEGSIDSKMQRLKQ